VRGNNPPLARGLSTTPVSGVANGDVGNGGVRHEADPSSKGRAVRTSSKGRAVRTGLPGLPTAVLN
jgi:hypothetical protein